MTERYNHCMQYVYFMRLRGQLVVLLKTRALIDSPKELFRQIVADPVNFQRVYDSAAPSNVTEVIMSGNVSDFLLCGDIHVFRKWLRSELLSKTYHCFAVDGVSPSKKAS